MNSIRHRYLKSIAILPSAVMFLSTLLTGTASASERDLPVKGSFSAMESTVVNPSTLDITFEATGCAQNLGFFSLSIDETVTLPALSSQGTFQLETSCGDTVFGTVLGQATLSADQSEASIVEQLTITGGTGRFKNATGTLTTHRLLDRATGVSSGKLGGTIDESKCHAGHSGCGR